MSDPVFWVEHLADSASSVTLTGSEGHHAARVLRMRVGEKLVVTDGCGRRAEGLVATVDSRTLTVAVTEITSQPAKSPRITVVQAIPKGERAELAVELMTELEVDEIVPWAAEHSIAKWRGDRAEKALAKWRSAAFAAAKQSRRTWFPRIEEPVTTNEVISRIRSVTKALVLHETANDPLATVDIPTDGELLVIVGPEGGISSEELAQFTAAGARSVRLGHSVLRTSTAGAAALAVLNVLTNRWK